MFSLLFNGLVAGGKGWCEGDLSRLIVGLLVADEGEEEWGRSAGQGVVMTEVAGRRG